MAGFRGTWGALVAADEVGAADEHAAAAAGGVQETPVEGFDDFDQQVHHAGRGEELAALLALFHGETTQEILVNLAESVTGDGQSETDAELLSRFFLASAGKLGRFQELHLKSLSVEGTCNWAQPGRIKRFLQFIPETKPAVLKLQKKQGVSLGGAERTKTGPNFQNF